MARLIAVVDALRQPDPRYRPGPLALLAAVLLAALLIGANPLAGQTLAPLDLLVSYPGWRSVDPAQRPIPVLHHQRSDVLDYVLPAWDEARSQLRQGRFPVWLHAAGGGGPGIQLPLSGLMTPSFLLFALAPSPAWGLYLAAVLKLVIAGLGMYWLLRLFSGPAGALLGAMSFAACGFHAAYFFWPQMTTSIWLPWLFLCTVGYQRGRHPGWLFGLAAVTALLILGGFPSVAAFGLYAWALFALWLAGAEWVRLRAPGPGLRLLAWLALAVAAGFALCAYSLHEISLYLEPIDLDYRDHAGRSRLGLEHLIYLIDPLRPDARGMPPLNAAVYVGLAALPLAACALILGWRRSLSIDRSLLGYCTLLTVLSLLIGYGLVNGSPLERLPVFDRNPWHRGLGVLGFALAALAALGLQSLLRLIKRDGGALRIAVGAGCAALLLAHGLDLARCFGRFNAVVPGRWYYPPTPALAYIQNHLGPGQSVIADVSFMVSGTLGAYGIPEWFAHRHRTESEKKLLRRLVAKPFVTPTAARFPASRIRSETPAFRELGVRYLVTGRPLPPVERQRALRTVALGAATAKLRQPLWVDAARVLTSVRIQLGSAARDADRISLRVFDHDGRLRARARRPAVRETDAVVFEWTDAPLLRRGLLTFELELAGVGDARLPLVAELDRERRLRIDGRTVFGRLAMGFGSQWRRVELSDSVHLYQLDAPDHGPYLRPAAAPRRPLAPAAIALEPGLIRAEFAGPVSGEFVWTGRLDRRWRAVVDGRPASVGRRYDVLPSVRVEDARSIELRYPVWQAAGGLAVTLLGLIGCALGAVLTGRGRR